jgi:hypothetical protein
MTKCSNDCSSFFSISLSNFKINTVRTINFCNALDEKNILRVRFETDRGRIVSFMVQLECLFDTEWTPVVRYDTTHGFAHCDRMHPWEKAKKTRMVTEDFNDALTYAMHDLASRWQDYRRRYLKWKEQK